MNNNEVKKHKLIRLIRAILAEYLRLKGAKDYKMADSFRKIFLDGG